MTKCVICDHRPARDGHYCSTCGSKVESLRNGSNGKTGQPKYFLTYRGDVVGLFPDGQGTLKSRLLKRSPDNLPKYKTLNLDKYVNGYSRQLVKRFKACVLQLANA